MRREHRNSINQKLNLFLALTFYNEWKLGFFPRVAADAKARATTVAESSLSSTLLRKSTHTSEVLFFFASGEPRRKRRII